ncbi:nitroimidazol reductase NimA-like FMN-containing flavoprotein (pyridoxamine 5'-phosphate oxidase superfamily) [Actinomycetospora cinnamomea]|uniref:Nitroimidazol reductase NimA-like FMN-containing flavoprotein (Pyridoxamine 5'-phosphate oxidase superfamily) n=2 Tax=Actinomycetospora cinnamomea TaxID=663609 RepID=A0A2U1F2N5_9PSEU|nr:nitroimidazol reductase NimA-like FMN-containing flavoprotein (pyridoxamine 5'-phosphate oxidase superfamily) [Actinomycetospora cinnamomea]
MDTCRETEALPVTECWTRLASVPVGRLVFTERALPAVHPVNFLVHGRSVIIRTGPGTKLDAARRGDVVAFEADHIDPGSRTGWSVLVVGHAAVVGDVDRLVAVLDPQHRPWVRGRGIHVIEVCGERVTGRRLVLDRNPAA